MPAPGEVKRDALFAKYHLAPAAGTGMGAAAGAGGNGTRGGNGAAIHR
jgi:hypothetical protein